MLTTVLSINSVVSPWNNHCWHAVCSLNINLQDWLPGVAGTDPRLGYRFGASITKMGACTSPLFHFYRRCSLRPKDHTYSMTHPYAAHRQRWFQLSESSGQMREVQHPALPYTLQLRSR